MSNHLKFSRKDNTLVRVFKSFFYSSRLSRSKQGAIFCRATPGIAEPRSVSGGRGKCEKCIPWVAFLRIWRPCLRVERKKKKKKGKKILQGTDVLYLYYTGKKGNLPTPSFWNTPNYSTTLKHTPYNSPIYNLPQSPTGGSSDATSLSHRYQISK